MKYPFISIIITTYNRAHFLPATITSILNQTYKNFELLIIDDGSTDNTSSIVNKFLFDKRVKYFHINNSGGPSRPRNVGVNLCNYYLIAFCDDDDIWVKNKLRIQVDYLIKYNLDFVSSNMILFKDEVSHVIGRTKNKNVKSLGAFIYRNEINTSTVILKKSELIIFNENIEFLNCGEDYLLWLQLFSKKYKFGFINEPLVYYRISDSNISKKSWVSSHIVKIIIHLKIFLENKLSIKLLPFILITLNKNIFYFLLKYFLVSVRKNPFSKK
jgi:glycosyltransferase involved in cell wall biosynthesis